MANKPRQRIEWTIERACYEWDINPRTLSARLTQAGIDPDADGHYTTIQIDKAKNGDLTAEKIRETRSKADLNEQELRTNAGELVDKSNFAALLEPRTVNMARVIRASKLTELEQDQLMTELSAILKQAGSAVVI